MIVMNRSSHISNLSARFLLNGQSGESSEISGENTSLTDCDEAGNSRIIDSGGCVVMILL